jgi:hypothetical protein
VETERRLRAVIRAAEVAHLEGVWCFRRFRGDPPPGALATVRDDAGWSALVPDAAEAGERFRITRTTFSSALENSGFVGWLAMTIKQRLGSGVFVVCGHNPERGGIFDYWGYPTGVAGAVRGLIDGLREELPGDAFSLDLRVFEVVEASPASVVSGETVFEFHERDGVVEASYAGGEISGGRLIGSRHGDQVAGAYTQLLAGGGVGTGTTNLSVEPRTAGAVRLIEDYVRSDGVRGRNILESVGGRSAS